MEIISFFATSIVFCFLGLERNPTNGKWVLGKSMSLCCASASTKNGCSCQAAIGILVSCVVWLHAFRIEFYWSCECFAWVCMDCRTLQEFLTNTGFCTIYIIVTFQEPKQVHFHPLPLHGYKALGIALIGDWEYSNSRIVVVKVYLHQGKPSVPLHHVFHPFILTLFPLNSSIWVNVRNRLWNRFLVVWVD